MQTTMQTTMRDIVRTRRGKGSTPPAPIQPEQPTLIEQQPAGTRRPTHHNGVLVLEEELLMHLPNAPFRVSKIHLENGKVAFACRDCDTFTGDSRGQVMEHRNREHGARYGKRKPKVELVVENEAPDLVLPERAEGVPAPSDPLKWTIEELLRLLPSISALGDLVDSSQEAADEALAQLGDHRANQFKIDGYDDLREELHAAKLQLRQQSNYADLLVEVHRLKAWEKRTIAKFKQLGFVLAGSEADQ